MYKSKMQDAQLEVIITNYAAYLFNKLIFNMIYS